MTLCCGASSSAVGVILTVFMCVTSEVNCVEGREEPHRYTIEELLSTHFENKDSNDIGMDPCKAENFQGDIAIPDVDYFKPAKPAYTAPSASKINKSLQEEVERLKKEVLLEGLQVEEEGLTDILRKRTKQPLQLSQQKPKKYNEASINTKAIPPGLDKALLMKHGRLPPDEDFDETNFYSQNKDSDINDTNVTDNLTESESLEQDGVLVVNISSDNILNLEEFYPHLQMTNFSRKMDENTNKIQSNSREITGDFNNNLKFKELPENITVAPAPTNGVLPINEKEEDNETMQKEIIHRTSQELYNKLFEANDLLKPTASLQSFLGNTSSHKRRRRRRHGNGRRLRNISNEKKDDNVLKHTDEDLSEIGEKKKSGRRQKKIKYFREDRKAGKFVAPEHEFEDKFDLRPPPKDTKDEDKNITDPFEGWFVRDTDYDLEVSESRFYNHTERRHRTARAATNRKERIWENGVIPYEIDGNFSGAHKSLFKQAMRHWENFTCVKFVERESDHKDYIVFTERPCGCCSFVGKRGGGAQAISIGKNCDKFGIVVHELGHVVGFWHEHTRPDRDRHVQIIRDNIMTGQEYNFNKLTEEEVNSLGQTYDYDSIMHYARNTFSKGTYLDTILPLEVHGKKRPEIGQRVRLSASDIAQTNLLYKCAKCGKTFLGNAGWFNSPGWGSEAAPATQERCEWRIVATHGERVVLNITEIDIHKSDGCRSEWVEVWDGYMPNAPVLGRICGSGKGPIMRSTGSRLTVVYQPGPKTKPHRGFRAHYEAVCGGDIEVDSSGHLESPNYPDDYQPNKLCIWKLSVPQDYQVALRFHSFEVENHDTCNYDKVKVRDGDSLDSPLIGMFCGHKIPPDIRSTSNKLLVIFESDSSVQKAGFSATFMKEFDECASIDHGCSHSCVNTLGGYECACDIGYELHSDGKKCESEYPESFSDTFMKEFDECASIDHGCSHSCVNTLGGYEYACDIGYELHSDGKKCESEYPESFSDTFMKEFDECASIDHGCSHSCVNTLGGYECACDIGCELHSDGKKCESEYPESFSAAFMKEFDECASIDHGCSHSCVNTLGGYEYACDIGCELHSDGKKCESEYPESFSAAFMKEFDECASIDHGCSHSCVNTLGGYECACDIGYELHSDGKKCENACGGVLYAPNGTITSPSFPDLYPPSKNCLWEIVAPPQHRITLNFTHFDLEGSNNMYHQECEYDSVTVHSRLGADVLRRHGAFCGSVMPPPVTSDGSVLRVQFTSDTSVHHSGFAAAYYIDVDECADNNGGCQHECHNTLGGYECACHSGFTLHPNKHDCKEGGCKHDITHPHGTIFSPNYPDTYPPRKDCVWQFSTTPGHRIKLIFNVFELEPHQECTYDHVTIYDGASADEKTLGRFCGSKLPHPVVASQNQMYVVFKSDASVQRKGFLATYSTACGGYLAASETVQHVYSHARYGHDAYESRANCDWSIVAPLGQFVRLTFLTFELEPETDCGYDHVQVFGGLEGSAGDYGSFCGTKAPPEIVSTTEALLLKFRTDDSIVFKGFSASYQAVKPEVWSGEDSSEGGEDLDEEEDEQIPPLVVSRRGLRAPLQRFVRRPT